MFNPRHSPVLAALKRNELDRLMRRAVPRHLLAEDILFLAGDDNDRIHVVDSGVLKFTARDGEGTETILGLAVEGDLVGDVAAIDGDLQPLDAVAAVDSEVIGFESDFFLELIHGNGDASLAAARALAHKTRWLAEAALERTSGEVEQRLAARLLDLADMLGRVRGDAIELELPLAQKDLGRLAGMCRESACKTLRSFQAQGLLEYQGRRLRIHRPDALHRIRCAGRARAER